MFSHVFIGVSDFERALAFYEPLMATLGNELRFCERGRVTGPAGRRPARRDLCF